MKYRILEEDNGDYKLNDIVEATNCAAIRVWESRITTGFCERYFDKATTTGGMTEHDNFVTMAVRDAEFRTFVDKVSPRATTGIQPVFLVELFAVLQLLWEIFQFLQGLGIFKKWFQTMKVEQAMLRGTAVEQEAALKVIRDYYVRTVRK